MNFTLTQIAEGQAASTTMACGTLAPLIGSLAAFDGQPDDALAYGSFVRLGFALAASMDRQPTR